MTKKYYPSGLPKFILDDLAKVVMKKDEMIVYGEKRKLFTVNFLITGGWPYLFWKAKELHKTIIDETGEELKYEQPKGRKKLSRSERKKLAQKEMKESPNKTVKINWFGFIIGLFFVLLCGYGVGGTVFWRIKVDGDNIEYTDYIGIKHHYKYSELSRIDVYKKKTKVYKDGRLIFTIDDNLPDDAIFNAIAKNHGVKVNYMY